MKQIYFHIGQPKAASTFLQQNVFTLLDDQVCFNPSKCLELIIQIEHKIYIEDKVDYDFLTILKSQIDEQLNALSQEKVLFSRELMGLHFGDLNRAKLISKALHFLFPAAHILIVFREQVGWIKSLYSLNVKYGFLVPYNKFLNYKQGHFAIKETGSNFWSIDYEALKFENQYHLYKDKFDEISCFNFDDLKSDPSIFIQSILNVLGARLIKEFNQDKVNTSYPENRLYAISILSKYLFGDKFWDEKYIYIPHSRDYRLKEKLKYLIHAIYNKTILWFSKPLSRFYLSKKLYSEEQIEFIQKKFEYSNSEFWSKIETIKVYRSK